MKKIIASIAALGLWIHSSGVANAKQATAPIVSKNTANNSLTNNSSNISNASLSYSSNDEQLIAQSVARLNFSWRIAPFELAAVGMSIILKGKKSDFDALARLLASGHDLYVVRVRLHNTGNLPLRVYPQNIKVYYRNGSTSVIPVPDYRFLQPDILRPGYYIDKPVLFIAPSGLNLLRDVRMGYRDSSIRVINN
ncbi:hypothetical protein [Mastigocoleus testarum]|uniref:DUF4352 domain-containing protein n=1 Tax=Mastigocoleus testarum BC008 TaxID=371196 RepID=A0A0V7ZLV1_9CYAN|nr:hypothetical protein [Mastigocoleus testarum]KST65215.1 hypothetical protein BC008_20675 [Mastigocoleus testarum BC008]